MEFCLLGYKSILVDWHNGMMVPEFVSGNQPGSPHEKNSRT
jgi:hypothetical protein